MTWERIAVLCLAVLVLLLVFSLWRTNRARNRAWAQADYWSDAYLEANKKTLEAAENARQSAENACDAGKLLEDRHNRVVEQRVEITELRETIRRLCNAAGLVEPSDLGDTVVMDRIDADATQVLAPIDPGVTDTSGLDVHGGCRRDHEKGLHHRECVHCKPKMHPVVSHVG